MNLAIKLKFVINCDREPKFSQAHSNSYIQLQAIGYSQEEYKPSTHKIRIQTVLFFLPNPAKAMMNHRAHKANPIALPIISTLQPAYINPSSPSYFWIVTTTYCFK